MTSLQTSRFKIQFTPADQKPYKILESPSKYIVQEFMFKEDAEQFIIKQERQPTFGGQHIPRFLKIRP